MKNATNSAKPKSFVFDSAAARMFQVEVATGPSVHTNDSLLNASSSWTPGTGVTIYLDIAQQDYRLDAVREYANQLLELVNQLEGK